MEISQAKTIKLLSVFFMGMCFYFSTRLNAQSPQISGDGAFVFSMPDGFSHVFGEKPGSAVYIRNSANDTIAIFKITDGAAVLRPDQRASGSSSAGGFVPLPQVSEAMPTTSDSEYNHALFKTAEKKAFGNEIEWKYSNPAEKISASGIKSYYNVAMLKKERDGESFLGIFNFSGKWYYIQINSKQHSELADCIMDSIKTPKGAQANMGSIPGAKQIIIIGLLGILGIGALILLL